MATIISPGRKPEPPAPWYLKQSLTCPKCGCVFRLEKTDMLADAVSPNFSPKKWRVVLTEKTPGGRQVIEGDCPDCREYIRIEGRMGGGLPTIGGSVTIGGTTYNKRDVATGGIVGGADHAPVGEGEMHVHVPTDQRDIEEITRAVAAKIGKHCRERSRAVGIS